MEFSLEAWKTPERFTLRDVHEVHVPRWSVCHHDRANGVTDRTQRQSGHASDLVVAVAKLRCSPSENTDKMIIGGGGKTYYIHTATGLGVYPTGTRTQSTICRVLAQGLIGSRQLILRSFPHLAILSVVQWVVSIPEGVLLVQWFG